MAEDTKPLAVKVEEAKAIQAQGGTSPPSDLSISVAEEFQKKVDSWMSIVRSPLGKAFLVLASMYGGEKVAKLVGFIDGNSKGPDVVLKVEGKMEVTKMPVVEITESKLEPIPIPLPKPTNVKPLNVITFSSTVPPLDQSFWDGMKAQGHTVTHYKSDAVPTEWAKLLADSGGAPRIFVANATNLLANSALTDKTAAETIIKTWSK